MSATDFICLNYIRTICFHLLQSTFWISMIGRFRLWTLGNRNFLVVSESHLKLNLFSAQIKSFYLLTSSIISSSYLEMFLFCLISLVFIQIVIFTACIEFESVIFIRIFQPLGRILNINNYKRVVDFVFHWSSKVNIDITSLCLYSTLHVWFDTNSIMKK